MSRIINIENAGKERSHLVKMIVLAIRELSTKSEPGPESRDLVSFIILSLTLISKSIDLTVEAWEKRGYWVKADHFRMEWVWTEKYGENLLATLLASDWDGIVRNIAQIAQKLNKVTIPTRNRMGTPWVGAWKILKGKKENSLPN